MFEHLDDPAPPALDRDAVVARGRSLRRRRRAALAGGGSLACVLLAGLAGALYVDRRDGAIDRVEVTPAAPSTDGAVNVLLVGLDEHGGRSDTMAVVRLVPAEEVAVLFVPRDLWDAEAGNRLNQAATAGPQATVDAVTRLLGIPVDHYVALDMRGFAEVVDGAGGLPVAVGAPVRDRHTGLALEPSECTTLDGETALALVRSRHLEEWDGSAWVADPRGDLGRIDRGRAVVAAAVGLLVDEAGSWEGIDRLSRLLADHAVVDDGLTLERLVELGRRLADAGPGGVSSVALPVVPANEGGAAVLHLDPRAASVAAQFGGPPAEAGASFPGGGDPTGPVRPC